ncbi:hypothetical protein RINTHM_450 [Richelia intracellularis HM01]|nr:hypothetical protein RINTHM_450 [Richelia intracellularis HM01]
MPKVLIGIGLTLPLALIVVFVFKYALLKMLFFQKKDQTYRKLHKE